MSKNSKKILLNSEIKKRGKQVRLTQALNASDPGE